ncbi:MAG: hypothetical protein SV760_10035, partial [Halobacteria archaeon]|nr:hypothetical protein [Halobacteria archaeon]
MTEDDRVNDTEEETDRDDVEDDGFGYSVEGTWDEIVEFGESIVSAFESSGIERETISEWDSWRPRSGEETTEMREKTVEKAKVDEGEDTSEMVDETAEHLSKT